jgi:hypothetical protein
MWNSKSFVTIGMAVAVAIVVLTVTLTRSSGLTPNKGKAGSAVTATTDVAQSPQWTNRGSEIIASKQSAASSPYGAKVDNSGNFAVQSQSVDVTAEGTYQLLFPMSSTFNPPVSPSAIAYYFPPDIAFKYQYGAMKAVTQGASRYFSVTIDVSQITAPYSGLTVWAG